MAGIDNIIKQIEADSDSQCEAILSQAEASAGRIVSQARDEARLAEDDNRKALEKTRSRLERSARSSADLVRRQAVLNAKYDIVGSVLTKAYASILDMDKDDYLEFILKLIDVSVLGQNGICRLSRRDLDRFTEQDKADILSRAKAGGSELVIDSTPAVIDGGFVLVYGGIEINCSLKSLFHDRHSELTDAVNRIVFG